MKKIVTFALVLLLIFSLSSCFDPLTLGEHNMSGGFSRMDDRLESWGWTFSAATANGHSARYIALSIDELKTLHVEAMHEGDGTIFLTITQAERIESDAREARDEVIKTIELTGGFSGYIDTSELVQGEEDLPHAIIEGRTHFRLQFEHVEHVDIVISWN